MNMILELNVRDKIYIGPREFLLDIPAVTPEMVANVEVVDNWRIVRNQRDKLILETDWTQLIDSQLKTDTKNAFTDYRQALRDIPQKFEHPDAVIWPEKPVI